NLLLIVAYLPHHNALTPSNFSGLGYQLSQYDTPGVFRMYVSSVNCSNMKSATSAREILALIVLSVTGKPCRYRPVRPPFVKPPGRTMIQSVRLCLTNSSCISCSANPWRRRKGTRMYL